MINLDPEWGVEWGIWGGRTEEEVRNSPGFATPQYLGLSEELTQRLRGWNRAWLDNYVGPDRKFVEGHHSNNKRGFSEDFDLDGWIREGFIIAKNLERETGYGVRLGFTSYLSRYSSFRM
ncbi:hypothetical protein F7230_02475 [Corynebacterium sp. 320]|uniref:hypothetical protein n=1 Tax=Corynebacterium TaxID=1716 RepID=UPI00125CA577|nr:MULTISPECIES: hypothetical protein [Corynebacterium]KAB1503989.1 hypothetical protein F7230_02475 [Corynebacterium sp. 320]KAB1552912.1 hypothetical protein F7233_04120 [Corynebacterium sp. 321]KAB3528125.1 hypothetical protein F8354_02475 [Corynebacterium sp. 250]KAB3540387.1 hypothetical protein F8390_03865 [Corynebacterium sp. 366]QNP91667.1 hypothetical protein IAU67_06350 [Corynebacterium zhongnanshanii]